MNQDRDPVSPAHPESRSSAKALSQTISEVLAARVAAGDRLETVEDGHRFASVIGAARLSASQFNRGPGARHERHQESFGRRELADHPRRPGLVGGLRHKNGCRWHQPSDGSWRDLRPTRAQWGRQDEHAQRDGRPDQTPAGTVSLGGVDIGDHPSQAKAKLGVQLQATSFQSQLTIKQIVPLYAGLYGLRLSGSEITAGLQEIGLGDEAGKPFKQLSGGQQQRLSLYIAVIHNPALLLLDEPTAGLDPQSRRQLWSRIELIRQRGGSILLTTHSMEEAEAVCDRVAIIDHGRLLEHVETPSEPDLQTQRRSGGSQGRPRRRDPRGRLHRTNRERNP